MDAVNMPVFLRRWWINKCNEAVEEEAKVRAESMQIQQQHQASQQRR